MNDAHRQPDAGLANDAASGPPGVADVAGDVELSAAEDTTPADESAPEDDGSLMAEASALIDDARTYAEAELAFQKTRAGYAGQLVGISLGLVIVAIILLHIAFLALAVGLVIALEPLVTIWGAIGIVFGGLLAVVGLLGWIAFTRVEKLAGLFASPEKGEAE